MQIKFKLKDEQNIEIIAYNGGEEKVIGASSKTITVPKGL